jgi:hypothetical protein
MHRAVIKAMCATAIASGVRLCAAQAEEQAFNANGNTPGAPAGNREMSPMGRHM